AGLYRRCRVAVAYRLMGCLPMKRWLKILAMVAGFVGACTCAAILIVGGRFGYELWNFSRPALSARKLARLNSEMDTNRVEALLGKPTRADVFTNDQGEIRAMWTYSRPSAWRFVIVYFGPDGKFEQHQED